MKKALLFRGYANKRGIFGIILAIISTHAVSAQVLMSGGTYAQCFDSLANTGTTNAWTDNITLPGWYASKTAGGNTVTNYRAGAGSENNGALYSFGDSGSTERALGSLASVTPGNIACGVRFTNDTAVARTNFMVSYTGEQWRVASTNVQKLVFSHRVGTSLTNADAAGAQNWTAFPALDFNSPTTNGTARALAGNDPTNRVVFTNIALVGVVVQPGQELFLRWFDADDAGSDDGLGIDNLTVAFDEAATNAPPSPGTNDIFSVLTYNLKGNGASDWSTNAAQVQAIARQLIHFSPDIIAFNEIPNGQYWQMTNWVTAFFPAYTIVVSPGTDGFIRNGFGSRFPITRWTNYLDGASLTNFGYNGTFTRDLLEAQIAVPGFSRPLHVFVAHLKSGTSSSDDAARRAAEAGCITNFFATNLFVLYPNDPYLLAGDMNEDIKYPATGSQQPIQRLTNGTGLRLTTPVNPITHAEVTYSIQGTLYRRYDYIFPCRLLYSNMVSGQVPRTDLLDPLPSGLNSDDNKIASDHLPVLMVFANPYTQPFRLTSITRSNSDLTLQWEALPGQNYRVECSPDLAGWTTFADNLAATNFNFLLNTNRTNVPQFFRVRRLN